MTDSSLSDVTRVGSSVKVTSGLKAKEKIMIFFLSLVPAVVKNIRQGFSRKESLDDVSMSRGSWREYSEFNIPTQMGIWCMLLQCVVELFLISNL